MIIANFFDLICGDDHPCLTRSARSQYWPAVRSVTGACNRLCALLLALPMTGGEDGGRPGPALELTETAAPPNGMRRW